MSVASCIKKDNTLYLHSYKDIITYFPYYYCYYNLHAEYNYFSTTVKLVRLKKKNIMEKYVK